MRCELGVLHRENIGLFRDRLRPAFALMAANSGGRYSPEDVAAMVESGDAMGFIAIGEDGVRCGTARDLRGA